MNCTACGKEVSGGKDTYGSDEFPYCQECDTELRQQNSEQMHQDWYGMAPHHQDLSITGSFIGSTVLHKLPEPNENGLIDCGEYWFRPDEETYGACGVYSWKCKPEQATAFQLSLEAMVE